ncbi:class I SAM-dependent methyltransferase [Dissulfurirhabdus thermomarina]|uniref:Class I SAM-dependent methyltransferase n=1 Tax=Dissulfurirhabdus thermomarina TaxID=1765737 RepID=A0A6N9TPH0_DISTH|nr:class I SAM-dependent methyltransferase [Dissulfurirhabdus thermomarina]NDY43059.1 class I SAM-dependent methyltransferase [Dissulfurirhabdus thermomarina]
MTSDDQAYRELDARFGPMDKARVLRTANLRLVPDFDDRRGGKVAYAEWAHVIGLFQALVAHFTACRPGLKVLDVGCGTGLLAIACEPYVQEGGLYVGMDVSRRDVEFCKGHYREPHFRFVHLEARNPAYTPEEIRERTPWDIPDGSQDLVTALSVWTHMNEADAVFYFREAARVLAEGGRDLHRDRLPARRGLRGLARPAAGGQGPVPQYLPGALDLRPALLALRPMALPRVGPGPGGGRRAHAGRPRDAGGEDPAPAPGPLSRQLEGTPGALLPGRPRLPEGRER